MKPLKSVKFVPFVRDVLGVTLTPAQRVLCLVAFDGVEPAELEGEERELARKLFGDVETIPVEARAVLVAVCGARSGKSRVLEALYSLWRALVADLSGLAPGEVAVALIVAPDMRLARQTLRFALGAAKSVPAIARLLDSETADGFTLRRPDGHQVAIECLPATRGGSALRGRTLVCAGLDEAAFFRDAEYAVNDEEIFRAVAPRVLPGGMVIVASTPWAETGLLFDEFQRNHGHPVTAIAAHAPTLLMNPSKAAEVARERLRNPENARREFDAEFLSRLAGTFFDPTARKLAVDELRTPVIRARRDERRAFAVDLGFTRNSSTGCVVHENFEQLGHYILSEIIELRPGEGEPLKPSAVCGSFASLATSHSCSSVMCDIHYVETLREFMTPRRIGVYLLPQGLVGKEQMFVAARSVLHEGRLKIPNNKRLLEQLSEVTVRPAPGGALSITQPKKRDGSHGDLVSALVGAVWALEHARLHPVVQRDYSAAIAALTGASFAQ